MPNQDKGFTRGSRNTNGGWEKFVTQLNWALIPFYLCLELYPCPSLSVSLFFTSLSNISLFSQLQAIFKCHSQWQSKSCTLFSHALLRWTRNDFGRSDHPHTLLPKCQTLTTGGISIQKTTVWKHFLYGVRTHNLSDHWCVLYAIHVTL